MGSGHLTAFHRNSRVSMCSFKTGPRIVEGCKITNLKNIVQKTFELHMTAVDIYTKKLNVLFQFCFITAFLFKKKTQLVHTNLFLRRAVFPLKL